MKVKNLRNILSVFAILAMFTLIFSAPALARTIRSYDRTIPSIGSITSGEAIKENNSEGINNNTAIGGNKRLNTSIRRTSNNSDITNVMTISPGSRVTLSYNNGGSAYKGANTTLALASKLGNTVKIQAQGSWSPDSE